ncbi:hypothetical protein HYH03_013576 [Edaphochlamys debaryana]|uniref:Protein-tyrosine-phosphatase n=1 Tax=Edaphochlamys debaryana TaxID=47281 RepID=A0A835XQN0_9CHLO|nr:hypothetical protein HYH03_013576 [Edaphochlamys debaryana]|eukprot:KAG2487860.1 hypothetical protein HYH03_013576 [Edaphochlamys debaryana]
MTAADGGEAKSDGAAGPNAGPGVASPLNTASLGLSLNSPQAVLPGLLISSFSVETSESTLKRQGVTHIVQVGIELHPSHLGKFKYLTVPVQDTEGADLVGQLQPILEFIDAARASGGVVLVHCMMGISRSASVCIAYLMWKERLEFVAAAERVYAARPCISPNPGFVLQLLEWERGGREFGGWKPWSRHRFLDSLEDAGGIQGAAFEAVMTAAGVSLAELEKAGGMAGGYGGGGLGTVSGMGLIVPSPAPPKRRPMPTKLSDRLCVIS